MLIYMVSEVLFELNRNFELNAMDGFTKEALTRTPLAISVLSLLDWVFDEQFLAGVFERHRGRSYKKVLSFSNLVALIQSALLEPHGSGHQSLVSASTGCFDAGSLCEAETDTTFPKPWVLFGLL